MISRLKHPQQPALLNLAGLTGFALLVSPAIGWLTLAGFIKVGLVWIALTFLAFFSLMLLIIWALGLVALGESDRDGASMLNFSENLENLNDNPPSIL